MGQFKFVLWLAYWYFESVSFEFEWDRGNSLKSNAKHGISAREVEEVFELKAAVPLGRQVSPKVSEERLCVVGSTVSSRLVSVVFTFRNGRVRPISARPASRKERGLYEEIRKTLERIRQD
ncbi:MAG: BrnT family toxin [Bdellovibrionia bacterium]